jgi:hypothetical protein
LIRELQDTSLTLERLQSQLKAVAEKFAVTGGARSALYVRSANEIDVMIFRKARDGAEQLQATADSDVLAGDVIEIDLRPARLLGATAAASEGRSPPMIAMPTRGQ